MSKDVKVIIIYKKIMRVNLQQALQSANLLIKQLISLLQCHHPPTASQLQAPLNNQMAQTSGMSNVTVSWY